MKKSTWTAVLAALLAVGILAALAGCFALRPGGGSAGGTSSGTTASSGSGSTAATQAPVKPEKVYSFGNYSDCAHYGYRNNDSLGQSVYAMYTNALKPNTRYCITFNYAESDSKAFLEENDLKFFYAYDIRQQNPDGLGWRLTVGGGMIPGYDYEFTTNDEGFFVLYFLKGPKQENAAETICNYIRDNLRFTVCEVEYPETSGESGSTETPGSSGSAETSDSSGSTEDTTWIQIGWGDDPDYNIPGGVIHM